MYPKMEPLKNSTLLTKKKEKGIIYCSYIDRGIKMFWLLERWALSG